MTTHITSHPLDAGDPLAAKRAAFDLPAGVIYLDGNSLGALPAHVPARVEEVVRTQWGTSLIRAWNTHGWVEMQRRIGDRIGRLVGAAPGQIVAGDSTSINLFKVLAAALALRPERKVILSDTGNFPTDLYMAQGLRDLLGQGHELRLVAPEEVADAIDESIAVTMITQVDYRTGRRHDMKDLTARAHAAGAIAIWDLAHSAGAFQVELDACQADFAIGCGYKYLNGGPGAPAFVYVAERHHATAVQPLAGWHGHDAPFAFDLDYRPAHGVDQMKVGTPPVLSMAALEAALEVFDDVDMTALRAKSVSLCELFIREVESRCEGLVLASPRNADQRGSQVSFRFPEGYALMQALIARGVIGDFRAPDIVRFGFTPLYVSHADVIAAVDILADILATRAWDRPEYKTRAKVT
ncbi:kynureninase [Microvirga tunisiensis]|uniref:Kynureninase n=2 Tax=Pannonibacter tanglangensis TaxID=2750084 RepID=A0ABW9ZJL8_9HYPH|nr:MULTISPECIES: kynureninase [unclassified Pannonibacter]NBN64599.1 kynureninase [Pannonibacter sp. XCT-34]NBN79134.1 kynureninase [Pannonibacter sp. XCT-53]